MSQVKSILKVSEQGVSRPYLCTDEEDRIRWCKGCHTGFRSVISEWVCACIARRLGLPIPDFAILKLDVDMFRQWRGYQANSVPEFSAGEFAGGHILRACHDAMPEEDKTAFMRKAAELVDGAFLEEAWSEMPEKWIDVGNDVLPLSRIKAIMKEGCDAGSV